MTHRFNGNEINIEKVWNGYIVEGKWNFTPQKIVCNDFDEVVKLLWKSFTNPPVGATYPDPQWKEEDSEQKSSTHVVVEAGGNPSPSSLDEDPVAANDPWRT